VCPKHRNDRRETAGWYRKIARGVCSLLKWHGREVIADGNQPDATPGLLNLQGNLTALPVGLYFIHLSLFIAGNSTKAQREAS
jgi:hypothetical protein